MILLAQRFYSINSPAFIFLGYCGIRWSQPAQEKQRTNKQAAGSVRSQKLLWKNEAEAKGTNAVLKNRIFCHHLSTGAIAVCYMECYTLSAGRK